MLTLVYRLKCLKSLRHKISSSATITKITRMCLLLFEKFTRPILDLTKQYLASFWNTKPLWSELEKCNSIKNYRALMKGLGELTERLIEFQKFQLEHCSSEILIITDLLETIIRYETKRTLAEVRIPMWKYQFLIWFQGPPTSWKILFSGRELY